MGTALNQRMSEMVLASARIVLGLCFVAYGIEKLWVVDSTTAYVAARLPFAPLVFWLAVLIEAGGGAMIVVGLGTGWVAPFLAFYCAFQAIVFHTDLLAFITHATRPVPHANASATPILDHFYSNMMIAAAFLCLYAKGPGAWALQRYSDWDA